ncbi:HlyD family efflux transporter periplasmic adaptor subunit [Chlorobium sp. BLA1]|uniref:efflux RND transporter periplasmic adaptor subunit n=1 Tax=Candidatus Chlorobium masyuteum TaxID=2716876 RepID=UPI00141EBE89|nr:HlyD family efflux transporter periplasmic adaptor subunit [Candidatus Chlorobium masyuteum]NHQ59066.1 HlyD family efflux transporter periplasmic adaptor subunit [Candidatus Chlorobium masyuteum]
MVKRNKIIAAVLAVVIVAGVTGFLLFRGAKSSGQRFEEIRPTRGSISSSVSTTGAVEPENRVKIKSSVGGRVEEVLVDEGQFVSKGTVLAMLSSTERAALLDAARLQGKSEQSYWNNVYKKTAVIAPMDGQVIVRSVNPGQTVTTSDSLFVLSDHLIVKAYVDETDIGRVKTGQKAVIGLDAYPEIRVNGVVEHIYYESRLQNNVSIYNVDVIPDRIPEVFRSGMSANIRIIVQENSRALLLPLRAVQSRNSSQVVMQKKRGQDGGQRYTRVKTGLQDDGKIEILSGITDSSVVLLPDSSFVLPKNNGGTNPFTPQRSRR